MTECYEKYLYGESTKIPLDQGIKDYFDLFIFTVGWESRCYEIKNYSSNDFCFNSAIIISFEHRGEKGYEQTYMDEIKSFVNEKTNEVEEIEEDPNNFKAIDEKIEIITESLAKKLKRPLKIGFDMTSCPRYYFLRFLAFCLRNNLSKKLSFFYSEGVYKSEIKEFITTTGEWKVIEIPMFTGSVDPEHKNLFIASIGFKGKRCKSLISNYEPEEIGILLPNPGYNDEYTKKAKDECDYVKKDFYIPEENITTAPAGDAVAAWESLKKKSLNKENYKITYLTLGPKPHVLAMGIHGFLNGYILTYRIPDEYTKMEVEPNGVFWKYEIKNLIFL